MIESLMMNHVMKTFRKSLSNAKHVLILTGSGISAESGVPTFRGPGGFWRTYRAQSLATPEAFRANPSLVWEFYEYRRQLVSKVMPNKAHVAISMFQNRLEKDGKTVTVITQNIDGLHQKAGTENVIELHGSLFKTRCTKCKNIEFNQTIPICSALANKCSPDPEATSSNISIEELPKCGKNGCSGLLRPDIVWFGENLEEIILDQAHKAVESCDACLIIGTSSDVYPAAMFAPQVAQRGMPVAEFNLEETSATRHFQCVYSSPGSSMANMFDTKEPVQQGDSNIIDDIIDVWSMDFSDPDTWLLRPSQDSTDDRIRDSHTWWKKNIDRGCNNSQENKRLIDTRTFTRPKKRSGRLSFESIGETSVSQPSNVWNPQFLENIGTKQTYSDDTEFTPSQQDHVPSMLRLSNPGVSSCMMQSPFISGHQSLESISCISQSKEIDTFVDLAKTESNEDIMEISQPSVFYSSIMSVTTDDVSADIERLSDVSRQFEIEDSQILTESMMEMSMFGDIYDINFNDTFAKNSAETTMLENITYCSPIDTTFLAGSVIKSKKTLDNTFNVTNFDRQTISDDTTWLNVPNAKPQNAMFNVDKFDATFDKTPDSSPTKSSNDFELKESVPLCDATMNLDDCILNKTFVAPCEKVDLVNEVETLRIDATFDKTIVLSPTESLNDYAPKESPLLKVSTKVAENIDPDLDDRLSVRSDGSNMSYTMGTTNTDQFQKIIHIQEECTGTNSSQRKIVAPRTISQTAVNQTRNPREYKTGIKPPSNWTSTDRPVSGIPRPRSRIPAPKFIRPSTKFNQGEQKK